MVADIIVVFCVVLVATLGMRAASRHSRGLR